MPMPEKPNIVQRPTHTEWEPSASENYWARRIVAAYLIASLLFAGVCIYATKKRFEQGDNQQKHSDGN
jgi:hypothetical protein